MLERTVELQYKALRKYNRREPLFVCAKTYLDYTSEKRNTLHVLDDETDSWVEFCPPYRITGHPSFHYCLREENIPNSYEELAELSNFIHAHIRKYVDK